MKVLVTGPDGQLGTAVVAAAPALWDLVPVDQRTADFTDPAALRRLADLQPDVIVNCAAYTDVDCAEADASTCWTINAEAPAVLAEVGSRLIHVSTDYVFDGTARTPYQEDAPLSGLGVYGRSKAAGEQAVRERGGTVVRTAWLYGPGTRNFVAAMLRLASSGGPLRVVDDQVGQPTYAVDVAARIVQMIQRDVPVGTYHATNSGQTSWYGFASEILRLWGVEVPIEPVTSAEFPRPAPRPSYSVLGHAAWARVGLPALRDWRDALAAARAEHAREFLP